MRQIWILILTFALVLSCTDSKKEEKEVKTPQIIEEPALPSAYQVTMANYDTAIFSEHYGQRVLPPTIDMNQPLEDMSLEKLVLLRYTVYAMKGHIFKEGFLRGYFAGFPWYQPPVWEEQYTIELTEPEKSFIERIRNREQELLRNNITDNKINPENIINWSQFDSLQIEDPSLLIHENGFFITKNEHKNILKTYENNYRASVPAFITTDLYISAMYGYFRQLYISIEEDYLHNVAAKLLKEITKELYRGYEKTTDPDLERAIQQNLVFYSVPYAIITGTRNNLIGDLGTFYDEIVNIQNLEGKGSGFLDNKEFDYSGFKPKGHYAQNSASQKYYKTMVWLQNAHYCIDKDDHLQDAVLIAQLYNSNDNIRDQYNFLDNILSYFKGETGEITISSIAGILKNDEQLTSKNSEELMQSEALDLIRSKIKARYGESTDQGCRNAIHFLSPKHYFDQEMLNETTRQEKIPQGLQMFAFTGFKNAGDFIRNEHSEIPESLKALISKYGERPERGNSLFKSWFSGLKQMNDSAEYFQNAPAWQVKNLNTGLAAWSLFKQDNTWVNAESIPDEQCSKYGGRPINYGYAEPNIPYWKSCVDIIQGTKKFLKDFGILSKKYASGIDKLEAIANQLIQISNKQLKKDPLTEEEHTFLSMLFSDLPAIVSSLMNTNKYPLMTGLVHAGDCSGQNCLVTGTGYVHDIFVPVEIDGYILLARGAIISYHEETGKNNLNSAQWLNSVEKGQNKAFGNLTDFLALESPVNVKEQYLNVCE